MSERIITIISSWHMRKQLGKDGRILFTARNDRISHLEFCKLRDGNLRVGNARVLQLRVEDNILTVTEEWPGKYVYEVQHYLLTSQIPAARKLQQYMAGKREWD